MIEPGAEYIRVDVKKVLLLQEQYEAALEDLYKSMPLKYWVNFNSAKQTKEYFRSVYNIVLPNVKIATIEARLLVLPEGPERDFIEQFVAYLKLKYSLKNYIYCILTHEHDGYVMLRWVGDRLCMPNKQPLSHNEEINACIIEWSNNVSRHIHLRMPNTGGSFPHNSGD